MDTAAAVPKSATVRVPPSDKELFDLSDLRRVGIGSRSTVWRLEREDASFPEPILIRGMKRWIPAEIREWIRTRPRAGKAA